MDSASGEGERPEDAWERVAVDLAADRAREKRDSEKGPMPSLEELEDAELSSLRSS